MLDILFYTRMKGLIYYLELIFSLPWIIKVPRCAKMVGPAGSEIERVVATVLLFYLFDFELGGSKKNEALFENVYFTSI